MGNVVRVSLDGIYIQDQMFQRLCSVEILLQTINLIVGIEIWFETLGNTLD